MSSAARMAPPDQSQRECALDPSRSILVRAPAGSGKTDLLTRRFLRLLAEVDDPTHVVAVTFTKAAAAEMQNRILSELEKAATATAGADQGEFSVESLARRALERSRARSWDLLQLPSQLRISTIDSFCREIALRRPLLSTLGGRLDITDEANALYSRAANRTLMQLANGPADLKEAIEALLLWRDNNWQELENHLILMLGQRDRWLQEFWIDEPDWAALRDLLERPFARAIADQVSAVEDLLMQVPDACQEAMELARFACANLSNTRYTALAELADFPAGPFSTAPELENARQAYSCLADLLLTKEGSFLKRADTGRGFPAERIRERQRLEELIGELSDADGLQSALNAVRELPPARYSEEDWNIVRACFTLLRHAAGQLQVAFAEAGTVDYIEVAQVAQQILRGEDNLPADAALQIADGIHHLLVDEFQDTSRRQHRLIAALVAAWPDTTGRTLFVVGDPMQSIYFFRDADAELFPRVQATGLELPDAEPWPMHLVQLQSNFRTRRELVDRLNQTFAAVFAVNDGSNVQFSASQPARTQDGSREPAFDLHLDFVPRKPLGSSGATRLKQQAVQERDAALAAQTAQIVELVRSRMGSMDEARARGDKYRIAVLGRKRSSLAPIAQALRDASIPFRAVDLERLADRPEVLDALALARALLCAEDRVAWLGVLRAPWCGLSLQDMHTLVGADNSVMLARPLPALMRERNTLLTAPGRAAVDRVLKAFDDASTTLAAMPGMSTGAWIDQVWRRLGGDSCVDDTARANLQLLWGCLDKLPGGLPDLGGPALDAALEILTALPDPSADNDCGVHLMTIHKSKGLEFEVVIVPDMQAAGGKGSARMFSWLERGLTGTEESGEVTEFLIAPFQTKGGDKGAAKAWVDRQYRAREAQETRRILYVAATRAREELHLFARPEYKADRSDPALCEPRDSLLLTAWPALEQEVRSRFDAWKSSVQPGHAFALAANADSVIELPSPPRPAILRRLPPDFKAPPLPHFAAVKAGAAGDESPRSYERHEGGLESRALGSAVHRLFQELARLRTRHDEETARTRLALLQERLIIEIRAHGFDRVKAGAIAGNAHKIVFDASHDPIAEWIVAPHPDAASEQRWTAMIDGVLHTVQADRVFRAGSEPLRSGLDAWWIVDYKTAHTDGVSTAAQALPRLRALFAPQLEIYALVARKLHGDPIRIMAGLYYPRMRQFDWWQL